MTTLSFPVHHHMPFDNDLLRMMKKTLQEDAPIGLFFETAMDKEDIHQIIDMSQTSVLMLNGPGGLSSLCKRDTLPSQRGALCDIALQLSPHLLHYLNGSGHIAISAHGLVCYSIRTMGGGSSKPSTRILNNARAHIFETSHHARVAFQKEVRPLLEACAGKKTCESFTNIHLEFEL